MRKVNYQAPGGWENHRKPPEEMNCLCHGHSDGCSPKTLQKMPHKRERYNLTWKTNFIVITLWGLGCLTKWRNLSSSQWTESWGFFHLTWALLFRALAFKSSLGFAHFLFLSLLFCSGGKYFPPKWLYSSHMRFIPSRQLTKIQSAFLAVISLFIFDDLVDVILKSLGIYHPIYVYHMYT